MKTVLSACAILLCAAVQADPGPDVEVRLHGGLPWRQEQVRLGDIAHIRTQGLDLAQGLVNLVLVRRDPQRGVSLDRASIGTAIQRGLGVAPARIRWSGVQRLHMGPLRTMTPNEQALLVAREELERWLRSQGAVFRVTGDESAIARELPARVSRMAARPLPAGALIGAGMVVWVDTWSERGFERALAIRLDVELHAAHAGPQDPASQARALPVDIPEVTPRSRAPVPQVRGPGDASPQRLAAAGAADVQRGQWVTVAIVTGEVQVERRVQALHAAALGDTVQVRAAAGEAVMQGRVAGPGRVELMP